MKARGESNLISKQKNKNASRNFMEETHALRKRKKRIELYLKGLWRGDYRDHEGVRSGGRVLGGRRWGKG